MPQKSNIVIGKRIPLGGIVGGLVSGLCWLWNASHPGVEIPAPVAVGISAALTGIVQIIVVNYWGITVPDETIGEGDA